MVSVSDLRQFFLCFFLALNSSAISFRSLTTVYKYVRVFTEGVHGNVLTGITYL
jgi:hypothetical protein